MIPQNAAQWRALGLYALWALIGALVATGTDLGTMLAGSGDLSWRPLAATFMKALCGALTTTALASQVARYGSENLATDANVLRAVGYHRADLTVVPKPGAVPEPTRADATIAALDLGFTIMHDGHPALTALVPATGHEVLDASEARHLDGSKIDEGTTVTCDRCGARLVSVASVDGAWVAQGGVV